MNFIRFFSKGMNKNMQRWAVENLVMIIIVAIVVVLALLFELLK